MPISLLEFCNSGRTPAAVVFSIMADVIPLLVARNAITAEIVGGATYVSRATE
jgi:hypothetical protein